MLCRACDVIEQLGISKNTWCAWKQCGLRTYCVGTRAEFVMTNDLIDFISRQHEPTVGASHKKKVRKK